MGRLSYLVSTYDLEMRGARVSVTMEMSHFTWNIPIQLELKNKLEISFNTFRDTLNRFTDIYEIYKRYVS